jgi:translation initiation factor IF-2
MFGRVEYREQKESVRPSERKKPERKESVAVVPEEKEVEGKAVVPGEEEELKIPDRFKKEIETEKIEKFKAKPGMQRAFQTIRKIEPKRWHEQRPFKKTGKYRSFRWRRGNRRRLIVEKKMLKLQEGTTVKEICRAHQCQNVRCDKEVYGTGIYAHNKPACRSRCSLIDR